MRALSVQEAVPTRMSPVATYRSVATIIAQPRNGDGDPLSRAGAAAKSTSGACARPGRLLPDAPSLFTAAYSTPNTFSGSSNRYRQVRPKEDRIAVLVVNPANLERYFLVVDVVRQVNAHAAAAS